jgi:hypothetical protein
MKFDTGEFYKKLSSDLYFNFDCTCLTTILHEVSACISLHIEYRETHISNKRRRTNAEHIYVKFVLSQPHNKQNRCYGLIFEHLFLVIGHGIQLPIPAPLLPGKEPLVQIGYKAGRHGEEKNFDPTGTRTLTYLPSSP